VLGLTLGEAKTIAVVAVIAFLALAIAFVWIMQTIAQKAALAVIMGLLALLVWTQRTALDECADKVREGGIGGDTTCSFFGRDVRISTSRSAE
jgi:hypothetical protein